MTRWLHLPALVGIVAVGVLFGVPAASGQSATAPLNWTAPAAFDIGNAPDGISCVSSSFCAAVDGVGNVATSTSPLGGAGTWIVTNVDGSNSISAVSCPSTSLCVAVDGGGNEISSTDPTDGASATWTVKSVDGDTLNAVSCPSTTLCVAVDDAGNAVTSSDPGAANPTWAVNNVDSSVGLAAISCPSTVLCVAVDNLGNIVTSIDPGAASPTWTVNNVDSSAGLAAISCPSTALCVAVDGSGNVVTSTDPGNTSPPAWTTANVEAKEFLGAVSCGSPTLCVAADTSGNVITSTNPTGGSASWTVASVDDNGYLIGASCPSAALCVAVDPLGYILAGSQPPSATTGSAGLLGETTATLNGTVNPNGFSVTDCHFSYGIGNPSGFNAPCSPSAGSGKSDVAVSAALSGLAPGTTYEFQLVAKSISGTSLGAVGMFTTVGASLTVSKAGSGSGTVVSSPAGITCGATCSYRYTHGTLVTLTATAASGSSFAGWSGGGCLSTGGCTVTTNADTAVTATFTLNSPPPPPTKCVVPKVKGKTLSAAKRAIKSHACSVGTIKHVVSRSVQKGHVISQKPKPGSRLKNGAKVNLVISKGRR